MWEKDFVSTHEKMKGFTQMMSKQAYVKSCQKFRGYGYTFFQAKQSHLGKKEGENLRYLDHRIVSPETLAMALEQFQNEIETLEVSESVRADELSATRPEIIPFGFEGELLRSRCGTTRTSTRTTPRPRPRTRSRDTRPTRRTGARS